MKLIIAIIHDREKHRLTEALLNSGFTFTQIGSTGGFLRQGNVTLLIGVKDEEADAALETIRSTCGTTEQYVNVPAEPLGALSNFAAFSPHPIKGKAGGGVAFILQVDQFHQF